MRILVLGAGGIGGYFGGRLIQAGADVSFAVRPRRMAQLMAQGLVVQSPHGDFQLAPTTFRCVDSSTVRGTWDLIVLAPKAYDLDSALDAISPAVGSGTAIVPLLNGLRHIDALQARFGAAHVAGGTCGIPATLRPDGTVVQLGPLHRIVFGALPGTSASAAALLAALRDAFARTPVEAILEPDMVRALWEKFVGLTTLAAMTCLMRGSVGDILATDEGEALFAETMAACVATATAAGQAPREAALLPFRKMMAARGSNVTASMLRDLEAGHATEGAHIVGDMLARARSFGIDPGPLRLAWCHLQAADHRRRREADGG
ncbi:2-dehydropantoate 2-reductase [Rubrivivax albus]|uniref:2-dehydropantoate 2-reductase n=1 Tax=Rubrivivax albus TaxID=2499835 RepID=A0A437JT95_9BURK|nr:2-dehydropantoate 2-reductase [Rubrivivax albus]RVT50379.1 2-dehydropantoate 2-reductase [Rubrivivax albus]